MMLTVTISPAVSPFDRGVIEDAVHEALGDEAEFLGGGTLLGGEATFNG